MVLAYVWKVTMGDRILFNFYLFQYGCWVFVYNGKIDFFEEVE